LAVNVPASPFNEGLSIILPRSISVYSTFKFLLKSYTRIYLAP
jgi:hypothetical protein